MNSGIYKITNLINNKVYVGKSVYLDIRWGQHISDLRRNKHKNIHIQNAFNKYGEISFKFEIIEVINEELLSEKEVFWIKELKSFKQEFGYNKTLGGEGQKGTEETRNKISKSKMGKKMSEEARRNMSKGKTGKKQSKETIQKRVATMMKNGYNTKPVTCIEDGLTFESIKAASKYYNMPKHIITNFLSGKTKKLRCGLTFKFTN